MEYSDTEKSEWHAWMYLNQLENRRRIGTMNILICTEVFSRL